MSLLITGGCGSLGRAILTAALARGVDRIVVFDQDEHAAFRTREALGNPPAVRWLIGDVRKKARLERAMANVDGVIHCAARKWVATAVYNVDELVGVNIGGTEAVIAAAAAAGVPNVLIITSDKGVAATNAYGATKFLAECYAVSANAWTHPDGTAVAALRLGNLLWSRGSVAHVWRDQAAARKPITLTARGMTRYGIRLSTAGSLALSLSWTLRGGEVFVPRLQSYTLERLLEAVAPGAEVVVTGERGPGEKAHETLLSASEAGRAITVGLDGQDVAVLEPEAPSWTPPGWAGRRIPAVEWRSDDATPLPDLALDEMDRE